MSKGGLKEQKREGLIAVTPTSLNPPNSINKARKLGEIKLSGLFYDK